MPEFDVMPGNKALAHGVRLARVEVIPVFPITPQTTIIEYLADFVANGDLDAEYIRTGSGKQQRDGADARVKVEDVFVALEVRIIQGPAV